MLLSGDGHFGRKARSLRIVPPHNPLKFGEFIDHFGAQIGLGHLCGLLGQISIRANARRNFTRQGGDAGDPLLLASQLIVKRHIAQRVEPRLHARFRDTQVVLPKEFRICQTGRQHAGIARKDRRAIIFRLGVGHGDIALDPVGLWIADREEFLVLAHRGLEHFGGQVQIGVVNLAHQHDRPFNQPRDFGQKALILDHFQPVGESLRCGIRPDVIRPRGGV